MYFFIDLDDTLVNTTLLNNNAYNFALEKFGYERIVTDKRITRKDLHIDNELLHKIIEEKQNYFTQDWLKYRTIINQDLIDFIGKQDKNKCYIWTKADKKRAYAVIKQCGLYNYFNDVIFDDKSDLNVSIQRLKQISKGNNFTIFDDNELLLNFNKENKYSVIINKWFVFNKYII